MKKGITLVTLVITIIVMTILAGIVVFSTQFILVNTDKSLLTIDIAHLESLMNTYKIRKNGNIDFETTIFNTSNLSNEELNQFEGETITNNTIELYVIDLGKIDAESGNYGNLELGPTDRYLYSLTTGKVYYEYGLETDDITYYYIKDGEV